MNDWTVTEWIKNIGSSVAKIIKQFPITWETVENKPTAIVLTDDKSVIKQLNIVAIDGTRLMITFDSAGRPIITKGDDSNDS